MRYTKFIIHEYRGIQEPIEFDLTRESIFPLIGVNECGKTTILEAILAFDETADRQNGGRHLRDVQNLYSLAAKGKPRVSAEIELKSEDFQDAIKEVSPKFSSLDKSLASTLFPQIESERMEREDWLNLVAEQTKAAIKRRRLQARQAAAKGEPALPIIDDKGLIKLSRKVKEFRKCESLVRNVKAGEMNKILITRNLTGGALTYTLQSPFNIGARIQNKLSKCIVKQMDYILYFDDFRHDVPARIKIEKGNGDEWTEIIDTLFKKAHPDLDFFSLPSLDERKQKTVIAKAEKFLNKTLTEQWERFHLEERKSLEIHLTLHTHSTPEIELGITETTDDDDRFFFGIKDRSKGFFWFFNFVMRLEFNPKMSVGAGRIVYLLDEPGSYLHARAQEQLCKKLMDLSRNSRVFYCTHSHHLLDPHVIPFNAIRLVKKNDHKKISISTVFDRNEERRVDAAFQPVFEALHVRPAAIDLHCDRIVVVEGLYDFFAFDMLKDSTEYAFIPAVNANSIQYHISWLMAWGVDYRALWDNDKEGQEQMKLATKMFGEKEAELRFRLLPSLNGAKKTRLEELFTKDDIAMLRSENHLASNVNFNKAIVATYYAANRAEIVSKISSDTRKRFSQSLELLWQ